MHLERSMRPAIVRAVGLADGAEQDPSRPMTPRLSRILCTVAAGLLVLSASAAGGASSAAAAEPAITVRSSLLSPSGLSAWAIDAYLRANFSGPAIGGDFTWVERTYGLDARAFLAQAMHESDFGSSWLAQSRHNLFGWKAYDRDPGLAQWFKTPGAGVRYVAQQLDVLYLRPTGQFYNGPTLRGVGTYYASDPGWATKIAAIARDMRFPSLADPALSFGLPDESSPAIAERTLDVRVFYTAPAGFPSLAGLTIEATWTLYPTLGTQLVGLPSMSLASLPASSVTTAAARVSGTSALTASLPVPSAPGFYTVSLALRDSDGSALPSAERRSAGVFSVDVYDSAAAAPGPSALRE